MKREDVAIAAVCATFGASVVLYTLIRQLRHRKKPTPLPPVQPLAHHREQQLRQLESERYSPNLDGKKARNSFLLGSSYPSSPASLCADTTEDIPTLASCVPVAHDTSPLGLPNPLFLTPPASNTPSRNSSDIESVGSNEETAERSSPSSPANSASKHKRYSTTASKSSSSHHRPTSRLRPHSITSISPSYRSMRSVGVPHAKDSQIQIILPAPLAPEVYQTKGAGSPPAASPSNSQLGLADKWAPSLHRSTSSFTHSQTDLALSRQSSAPTERSPSLDSATGSPASPRTPYKQDLAPSAWRAGPDLERGRPTTPQNPQTPRSRSSSRAQSETDHKVLRKSGSQTEIPAPTDS